MAKSVKCSVSPHCSLCPEIGPVDYKNLLESMAQDGLIEKLSVLDNELLDGRARVRAADELGLVLTEDHYVHLKPGTEPRAFVLAKNLARRHLSHAQRSKMALELCQDSTPGGDRRSKGARDHSAKKHNDPESAQQFTRPEAAKLYQTSVSSLNNANKVWGENSKAPVAVQDAADKETVSLSDAAKVARYPQDVQTRALEAVRQGQARTLNAAAETIMKEERPEDGPGPSSGSARRPEVLYRTIVVDPPWPAPQGALEVQRDRVNAEYQSMTIEDIAGMDLSALADDGFVFLWCPQHHLPAAFRILEQWGLEYRFTMVWTKTAGIRMPGGCELDTEFVVVGARGEAQFINGGTMSSRFTGDCQDPLALHTVKPREFYDRLYFLSPEPRLELPAGGPRRFPESR